MKKYYRPIRWKQHGATLTELAIVFGVASLVFGGIWTAWETFADRKTVNQVTDQLEIISNNMRSLYASQNTAALTTTSNKLTFTTTAISQNAFPTEMVVTGGATVVSPWGGAVYTGIYNAGGASKFLVEYDAVPSTKICINLLLQNSTPGKESGLARIDVTGSATNTYLTSASALPLTASAAAVACASPSAAGGFTIIWYYAFGQGCESGGTC